MKQTSVSHFQVLCFSPFRHVWCHYTFQLHIHIFNTYNWHIS